MHYLNWKIELILKWLLFFMAIYGHILFRHWFSTFEKKRLLRFIILNLVWMLLSVTNIFTFRKFKISKKMCVAYFTVWGSETLFQ